MSHGVRRIQGRFTTSTASEAYQRQLLAPVKKWRKSWATPSNLPEGSTFKVCKWMKIDEAVSTPYHEDEQTEASDDEHGTDDDTEADGAGATEPPTASATPAAAHSALPSNLRLIDPDTPATETPAAETPAVDSPATGAETGPAGTPAPFPITDLELKVEEENTESPKKDVSKLEEKGETNDEMSGVDGVESVGLGLENSENGEKVEEKGNEAEEQTVQASTDIPVPPRQEEGSEEVVDGPTEQSAEDEPMVVDDTADIVEKVSEEVVENTDQDRPETVVDQERPEGDVAQAVTVAEPVETAPEQNAEPVAPVEPTEPAEAPSTAVESEQQTEDVPGVEA